MASSAEFLEREVKFVANKSSLPAFKLIGESQPSEYIMGAGTDVYYKHPVYPGLPVVRHRFSGNDSELTIKAQVDGNLVRQEVNLGLGKGSFAEVGKLLELQGYKPALEISKISHIFFLPYVVLSWYSVFDSHGVPLKVPKKYAKGRSAQFVEIELREDYDWNREFEHYKNRKNDRFKGKSVSWLVGDKQLNRPIAETESYCKAILEAWANLLKESDVLGINIPDSLWQMYGESDV